MSKETITRLSIDIPIELHKTLKYHVLKHDTNIKDYVFELIKNDLSEELEDYLLGQKAKKSEKEGSIGVKKSRELIKKLKQSKNK